MASSLFTNTLHISFDSVLTMDHECMVAMFEELVETGMASSLFTNTLHISFDSVLTMDHECMVAMFEELVETGLKDFLGCPRVIYEDELIEFFQNGSVRDGILVSTVNGKIVEISEELFVETFQLPIETSGKKRKMKFEFRLLNDILAKSVTVKAGSFDEVTLEHLQMMAAINGGIPINRSKVLFNIFKDMVTAGSRQAKGFAIKISQLLEDVPNLELGDSLEYIQGEENTQEKGCVKEETSVVTDVEPVVKQKRTSKSKSVSSKYNLDILPVAQEAVPLQTVGPTMEDEPVVESTAEEFSVWNEDDQMDMDHRSDSLDLSDDSSIRFDDNDTAATSTSLPVVATDFIESFAQLRASIDQVQFEQIRRKDYADKPREILLMHIRDLQKQFNARFYEQDRGYRALLTNIHKDMRDHKTAMYLDVVKSQQRISTQVAAAAFDNVDVRKEVKEINAKVTELDGQVATIRSELLDFRAQARENYNNLSSQLGELIAYINRGNDKKGEDSSGSRPDDQSRDVGTRGSGSESRRRGDKSGSKRKRSNGGGESPVRGIFYGPYLPLKRDAEYWIMRKKQF
ncbi:hypothetical protein F511_35510 [Dorcoceras hygrometricum]|uniref:Dystroglycan-like n=1 Tax=Dorcoceras hygrometricum TaxID=472368 RepID=A0A2Z7BJ85_9LAMI|nr:hypothetical protein F511_35510 [Dorcoceras hygrometricum]